MVGGGTVLVVADGDDVTGEDVTGVVDDAGDAPDPQPATTMRMPSAAETPATETLRGRYVSDIAHTWPGASSALWNLARSIAGAGVRQ